MAEITLISFDRGGVFGVFQIFEQAANKKKPSAEQFPQ
jgi:hypothetical protein